MKLIVAMGGFVGDLITVMYDTTALSHVTDDGQIVCDDARMRLIDDEFVRTATQHQLIDYISQYPVVRTSITDRILELSHLGVDVIIVYAQPKMIEYYAHRMRKFHPYYFDTVTFDQYVSKCEHYSRTWPAMFRHSIDVTDIHTDVDFLNGLPSCTVTDTAHRLFNQWLDLNPPGEFNDS